MLGDRAFVQLWVDALTEFAAETKRKHELRPLLKYMGFVRSRCAQSVCGSRRTVKAHSATSQDLKQDRVMDLATEVPATDLRFALAMKAESVASAGSVHTNLRSRPCLLVL